MKFLFILISSFISFLLTAHPHVFIDNRVFVLFGDKGLTGFRHEWSFDEMFSSTIIQEFDIDADGKFDEKEIKELQKGAFSNLKKHNYFTNITINGKRFKIQEIKDFYARIDEDIMIYDFFIPCEVSATADNQEAQIAVYDSTYFVQVMWASQDPYVFDDTSKVEVSHEVIEDEKSAYYFGQIIPEALRIRFRRSP
jgi:ABC-type uncharacterized transport system substrate-binding protein